MAHFDQDELTVGALRDELSKVLADAPSDWSAQIADVESNIESSISDAQWAVEGAIDKHLDATEAEFEKLRAQIAKLAAGQEEILSFIRSLRKSVK